MSESFTPGPWSIVPYGDGSSLVIHSDEDNRVCFMATASSDRPSSHASIRANARLIAAAPELFEALRELVAIRTIKDKLEEPNNGEWPDMAALRERTDAAWASARAALLKASPELSE